MDEKQLRDRIRQVIDDHQPDLDQTAVYEGTCNCGAKIPDQDEHALHRARAVIDDLGLTVETAVDGSNKTERHGLIRYGKKSRVVGKWEGQG